MIKLKVMKNIQIWILLLMLALLSCKKEKEIEQDTQAIKSEIDLGMPGYVIQDMEIDNNNQFYFVTWDPMVEQPGSEFSFRYYLSRKMTEKSEFEILDSNFVHVDKIIFDKNNNLWAFNYHVLFLRKNNLCDTIIKLDFDRGEGIFQCIDVDKDNNVWVGTSDGLYKIDELLNITKYTTENSNLTSNYIEVIHVDEGNNIWLSVVSTNDIVKITGNTWMVNYSPGSVHQTIWSITTDKNANLWIGKGWSDESETLVRFNGAIWETINPRNEMDVDVLGTVRHLISDGNRIYVVIEPNEQRFSNQLLTFDGINWNKIYGLPESTPTHGSIMDLTVDQDRHTLWIRLNNQGIYKLRI